MQELETAVWQFQHPTDDFALGQCRQLLGAVQQQLSQRDQRDDVRWTALGSHLEQQQQAIDVLSMNAQIKHPTQQFRANEQVVQSELKRAPKLPCCPVGNLHSTKLAAALQDSPKQQQKPVQKVACKMKLQPVPMSLLEGDSTAVRQIPKIAAPRHTAVMPKIVAPRHAAIVQVNEEQETECLGSLQNLLAGWQLLTDLSDTNGAQRAAVRPILQTNSSKQGRDIDRVKYGNMTGSDEEVVDVIGLLNGGHNDRCGAARERYATDETLFGDLIDCVQVVRERQHKVEQPRSQRPSYRRLDQIQNHSAQCA